MVFLAIGVLFSSAVIAAPSSTSSEEADDRVDWTVPVAEAPQAVVNGVNSSREGVVSLVAMDPNTGSGGAFCSATHISSRWILTAAHCVEAMFNEYDGYTIYAVYDDDVYNGNFDASVVVERVVHPQWDSTTLVNDLGLVRVGQSRSAWGQTVLNADAVQDTWSGELFTFVGYGITEDNGSGDGIKRETEIQFQGCLDPASGYNLSCSDVDARVLYSESPDTNVCSGDSGGPVFRSVNGGSMLVGVNSFVTPGCVGGGTGSARVDLYMSWIKSYEPNVYTDLSEVVEPGPTDTGSTDPGPTDTSPTDSGLVYTGDGEEPARPQPGDYERPVFGMCDVSGGSSALLWPLLFVFILPLSRRRH